MSIDWVDRVLEAMGFGLIFRGWMAMLNREAVQGDPDLEVFQ